MEGHSIQPHEAEMMVDLEALLAGAGDGLATVDELNGLFYGYQATPLDQAPAPIPAVETKVGMLLERCRDLAGLS